MTQGSTVAWFHCFSGIAGEMAMGALIDAGADLDEVRSLCDRLPLAGWELDAEPVLRGGIASTSVKVRYGDTSVVRTAAHIFAIIDEARLPERVRARAHGAFDALARAEGRIHGRPPEKVHFHELGNIDSIIDIVGTAAALEVLGIDEVYASAVAHGTGVVRRSSGFGPVPSPVTIELLQDAPTYGLDVQAELATPAGAALLASVVSGWGPMPSMTIEASGFGAGHRDLPDRPHVTQVVLGSAQTELVAGQPVTLLEANLDDATGETLAHAVGEALDAGAHEAWVTPVLMGRGRPGHIISALVDTALSAQVAQTLVAETGAQDLRGHTMERWPASRHTDEVDIEGRRIRVKVSAGRVKVAHDDAARAARHIGIPVREVVSLAEEAWRRRTRGELTEVVPLNPTDIAPAPPDEDPEPPDGSVA